MLSLTDAQKNEIRLAWLRNNPRILAETALKSLFAFGDEVSLDHDDQVADALYTGILAADAMLGTGEKTVEDFIGEFEREVLNGNQIF